MSSLHNSGSSNWSMSCRNFNITVVSGNFYFKTTSTKEASKDRDKSNIARGKKENRIQEDIIKKKIN